MLQSLSTEGSQPLNSKQSNKFSATRTSKHLNAETILKTDTPRTRELKTLRAKRLAYFADRNHDCTNTSAAVSSLEADDKRGSFDHKVRNPLRENLVNAEQKDSLIEKTLDFNESVQHTRDQDTQKAHLADLEQSLKIAKNDITNVCLPKPDYNLLENPTVSEIQKLRHIIRWAQKILKKSDMYSEEVMNIRVCQKANPSNEKEALLSRVNPDTEQPNTFNWSRVTDRSIHTGLLSSRLDGSHYSAYTSRSSESCSSLDLLRTSGTLVQNSSLTTSLSEELEQCILTDTGYSGKEHFGPNNIWERSFPEQGNACRDNISNNNWESKELVTQLEFPADENCHSEIGDVGALNGDKYFWIPLEDSSDEEDVTGSGERKEAFMQPFAKANVTPFLCNNNYEQPTLSARTVTLRKSPVKYRYSSADLLANSINLHNTTQHSVPTVCDKEKPHYAWEPIEAKEYLSGGYHKTSAEDSEAADSPDVLLKLEEAAFNFKSQKDSSVIPRLDVPTLCKGTTVSPNETTSANEKDKGIKLVSAFQERPSIEQFPERFRNLSVTNANKTALSYLSISPKYCSGKILDNRETENLLALENYSLKKEANHNIDENETRQKIIAYKAHSTLKLPSTPLLSTSDSSYSKKPNPQFIKEQPIERERGQITDENIDSFLHAGNLVKFCPDCTCGNSSTVNWCMQCGCVLIGIIPQLCTVSSNVDKISSSNPRGSLKKEKPDMLLKNTTAASKEHSEFVGSDKIYVLKYSKVNTCISSGTCEPQLSVYEKYLPYMEHLQKIRSHHQTEEQQPADVLLVKENVSQIGVVSESNSYYEKHETEKNNTASFKVSTCFSDYTDRKQIVYEQESEDNPMYKPDIGATPLEENAEENCIIPGVSVLQCAPQGKDFQQKKYVEPSKNIAHRAFLKQIFGNQEDQNLTFTECENKKETLKDAVIKPRRRKSIQSSLNRYQRYWEKSSISWSSYTSGAIKPRSTNTNRPLSADDCRRSRRGPLLHEGPSAVLGTKSKGSKRQLTKRPISADALDSKQAPQATPRSKTLLHFQNTAVASIATMKPREISEYLNNNALQPCDKLNCRGDDDYSLWLHLPDEIWIGVFTLLPHQDLCQVAQVCHRFRHLANDETLWKTIQIENSNCLNDDWLANIGHHQPQSLRLYRCNDRTKSITDSGLRELFRHCKDSLKELNVTSCSGPKLTGDTILLHASAVCRNITSVDVSWTAATSKGIIALAQASSRFYRLLVNGCQLTDESINILIKKHRTSLRELEVFGCHALSAHCLSYMARECPNLQSLNVGRLPKITTACLIQMVTCLKNLIVLNLSGLNAVHDRVVHHIVRQCPKMDRLTLSSCPQLTDVSLFEIGTYLPTIRHLDVSGCKKVTDTGVQALAMSCHKLQYLDLSSTATGKWGICLLAVYCNQNLECVKLSFCKELTEDAIKKLCKNCKRLKLLHLYGCHSIHDLKAIQDVNKQVKLHHDRPLSTVKIQGC